MTKGFWNFSRNSASFKRTPVINGLYITTIFNSIWKPTQEATAVELPSGNRLRWQGVGRSQVQQFPEPSIHTARGSDTRWTTEGPRTAIIVMCNLGHRWLPGRGAPALVLVFTTVDFLWSYPTCCVANLRVRPVGYISYNMYTVKGLCSFCKGHGPTEHLIY